MKSEIIKLASGEYKAFVYNSKSCDLINRRLKQYDGVQFELEGSEGIFFFSEKDYAFVRACISSQEND